jgi:hypothetical protein
MKQKHILTISAGFSAAITLLLLPIAINIATVNLPPWVKDNSVILKISKRPANT